MKKMIILTSALVISSFVLFAQTGKKKTGTASHKVYTCTMHPEVISDKPGKCPKCGMALVEKMNGKHSMDSSMHKMPMHKKDSTMRKKKMTS